MPTLEEEEAFSHLRARQGAGARYDADGAPSHELALARRGTAYFARLLNSLRNAELYEASTITGWTRAQVVAAVAFNAKDLTRMVETARLGLIGVDVPYEKDREKEIEFAATLPAHALRNLFKHSEVHLNVEWRDLSNEHWSVRLISKNEVPILVAETPITRARFIWAHSLYMNAGGSFKDIPPELVSEHGFLPTRQK